MNLTSAFELRARSGATASVLLLAAATVLGACADFDKYSYCAPGRPQADFCHLSIASIEPNQGPAAGGTEVVIRGTGFVEENLRVNIGTVAEIVSVTATEIVARTRHGSPGVEDVTVSFTTENTATLPGAYTYLPVPTVSSVQPDALPLVGGRVALVGMGFTPDMTVEVAGTSEARLEYVEPGLAWLTLPGGTGERSITLTSSVGRGNSATVAYGAWQPANAGLEGGNLDTIVRSRQQPDLVFAIGGGGLFKSKDGGLTWSRAQLGLPSTFRARWLALSPSTASRLFVVGEAGELYRSESAGDLWELAGSQRVYGPPFLGGTPERLWYGSNISSFILPSGLPKEHDIVGQVLAVTDDAVYVARDEYTGSGRIQELLRSTDGGASWTVLGTNVPLSLSAGADGVLYALFSTSGPTTLSRSTDRGATWTELGQVGGTSVQTDPSDKNRVFVSTALQLLVSTDQGSTFTPAGTIGAWGRAVAPHPTDPNEVLVATDRRGVVRTRDLSTWAEVNSGLFAFSPRALATNGTRSFLTTTDLRLFVSDDQGRSWSARSVPGGAYSVAADPTNGQRILVGTPSGVAESLDGGDTFTSVGTTSIADIVVLDANTVFGLTPWNSLQRSTDAGQTFFEVSLGLSPAGVARAASGLSGWGYHFDPDDNANSSHRLLKISPEGVPTVQWSSTDPILGYAELGPLQVVATRRFVLTRSADTETFRAEHTVPGSAQFVNTIAAHGDFVYVGRSDGIVVRADSRYQPRSAGLSGASVTGILPLGTSTLLAATQSQGLFRTDTGGLPAQ